MGGVKGSRGYGAREPGGSDRNRGLPGASMLSSQRLRVGRGIGTRMSRRLPGGQCVSVAPWYSFCLRERRLARASAGDFAHLIDGEFRCSVWRLAGPFRGTVAGREQPR